MYREKKHMNFKHMEELSQEGITDAYVMRFREKEENGTSLSSGAFWWTEVQNKPRLQEELRHPELEVLWRHSCASVHWAALSDPQERDLTDRHPETTVVGAGGAKEGYYTYKREETDHRKLKTHVERGGQGQSTAQEVWSTGFNAQHPNTTPLENLIEVLFHQWAKYRKAFVLVSKLDIKHI